MKISIIQNYKFILLLSLLLVIGFFCIEGASTYYETMQIQQQTEDLKKEIEIEKSNKEEKQAVLNGDTEKYIEKKAREKLGYAYPNEKIYYAY